MSLPYAGGLISANQREASKYAPHFDPIGGGESATYEARWSGIPVATATINASPIVMDGKKLYEVKIQAQTWKYLELIWKMRDSIESIFEAGTLQPRRFIFRQRENRKKIDTTASFDHESKKWKVHRQEGTKLRQYEFVSTNTFDPISAVYLMRSLDFKVGETIQLEVFGGKSRYLVVLEIASKERVALKNGEFDAYKIIPRITNVTRSGYAGRVREATVWISADEKRKPLKIVSQVFIGSVNIEVAEKKS